MLYKLFNPIDWIVSITLLFCYAWQAFRTDQRLKNHTIEPYIQEMKAEMTEDGRFQAQAYINKFPQTMNLGLEMMQILNETPEAANYMSFSSLAPDGKLYTMSVEHDKSKPKHQIIKELKEELAELKGERERE